MADLFSSLNPQQREAVTLPHVSALVLAGAGSGKTRVLTTRIAYLIQSGQVSPAGILAVTFTNKAAREMLTRLAAMLPINTRGMWIGTFHGLCNRFLRAHHRDAGLPQLFQILDSQDQQSAVKRLIKSLNLDEDKFKPREVAWFINGYKEEGLRASAVEAHDGHTQTLKELFEQYDAQCNREGVVDFPELLLRTYEVLTRNEPLREHYRARFKHILVDEFQDTNRLQYKWIKLLAGGENAVFAVGDDDQCLIEGTRVTLADGTTRAIERIRRGDQLRSTFGTGDFRAATVMRTYRRSVKREVVRITTRSGRRIVSTPEHTHFAGYVLGATPQVVFTYLMKKRGFGYRLGTSQVYTRGQKKAMVGFRQRSIQEHADAVWIVDTYGSENEARAAETLLSLTYGLPTLPFTPRKGKSNRGLVHDGAWLKRVFASLDTHSAAERLARDRGISLDEPHHQPRGRDSNRHNVVITLCGDRRGARPMHRVSLGGNDATVAARLRKLGFSVRPAKQGSRSWRVETVRADYGEAMHLAQRLANAVGAALVQRANLNGKALPFTRARSIKPGMVMVGDDGAFDSVVSVERLPAKARRVFDLDVSPTHNFIANGLVTHNSIYRFRGAEAANMRDFQREFAGERVIRLEQNYRSHGNILNAANALIKHNRERLGKNLWTDAGEGEPVRVFPAASDQEEAQFVVDEVKALEREGARLSNMALLYRANAQSRVLEHALFTAKLPYKVYGGLRFFERAEIKHALAYLRLAANMEDDGAFGRVVNFPARGIGARSLEQLQDVAKRDGVSLMNAAFKNAVGGRAGAALGAFAVLIDKLKSAASSVTLPELIETAIEQSGLMALYQSERDGQDRVENLKELVNAAASFVQQYDGDEDMLTAFLAHASLEAGENEAQAGEDALQLMTVHSAKGLEFDAVFVSGLEEGLFPHENSLTEQDGLEEERRLMYVAITRARKRLYFTYAGSRMLHGQLRYGVPSRFIDEVPEDLIKWIVPKERANAFAFAVNAGGFARGNGPGSRAEYGSQAGMAQEAHGYWASGKGGSQTAWNKGPGERVDRDLASARADVAAAKAYVERNPGHPFKIGQNVRHAKFGDGVIIGIEGRGTDARVQVRFAREGTKWLALLYAKLTAV